MKIEFPSEGHIPELKQLWARCFPDPEVFIDGFFSTGFSPDRCRILKEDEILAVLYWFDGGYKGQKLAYLYAVATDPSHRGRGLCSQLMADTHILLNHQSYAAALLLPGEPGLREMYRKFGYRDCCTISEFSSVPGNVLSLAEISWEEYAVLRPSFLPENGATQDALPFLGTYAAFYRGEDFLLAAARETDTLLGLELLGDSGAAPGILTALNCKKGTFRIPGNSKQTVMALALKENVSLPKYFGLTFD